MTFTPASGVRWTVSLLAIAGTLPYIVLKVLWLSGSQVGLNDPAFGRSTVMLVANGATLALELAAVALALAFVVPLGRRLPAWTVLVPMWVGTGFLAQILLTLVMQPLNRAPAAVRTEQGPIADWVFVMVYAGFAWLGVFLLTAAALYAHDRWGSVLGWRQPLAGWSARDSTRRSERSAVLVAVTGLVVGGVLLAVRARGPFSPPTANLVSDGIMVGAAVAGLLLLFARRPANVSRWVPVLLAWVGTAAVSVWAAYLLVVLAVPNELVGDAPVSWADLAGEAVRLGTGLLAAAVGIRLLADRVGGADGVTPAAGTAEVAH